MTTMNISDISHKRKVSTHYQLVILKIKFLCLHDFKKPTFIGPTVTEYFAKIYQMIVYLWQICTVIKHQAYTHIR